MKTRLPYQAGFSVLREHLFTLGWRFHALVALSAFLGLLILLPALFLYLCSRTLLFPGQSFYFLPLLLTGLFIAGAAYLGSLGSSLLKNSLLEKVGGSLKRKVLQNLHESPLNKLEELKSSDWAQKIIRDLAFVEKFISFSLPKQIEQGSLCMCAGLLLVYAGGVFTLIPLAFALVIGFFSFEAGRKLPHLKSELRTLNQASIKQLFETLDGIRTIRSQTGEPFVERRFENHLARTSTLSPKISLQIGSISGVLEFLNIASITLCLCLIGWASVKGTLTPEQWLLYPFLLGLFYVSAQSLSRAPLEWMNFLQSSERISDILNVQRTPINSNLLSCVVQTKSIQSLTVERLSIGHQGKKLAGPVDFQFNRGELWVMMGPSACGKSTFLEVLSGLRPALGGFAFFQDRDGKILWQSQPKSPVQFPIETFAYVEQKPYIFDGTVRENLMFGNTSRHSEAILWDFIERTHLYHWLRLFGGLDQHIPDRGKNLDHSIRFRIALCRALLLKRPFLLLDEPFASLEDHTIELLLSTLEIQRKWSGIVVITHFPPEHLKIDGMIHFENAPKKVIPPTSPPPLDSELNILKHPNPGPLKRKPLDSS